MFSNKLDEMSICTKKMVRIPAGTKIYVYIYEYTYMKVISLLRQN